MHQNVIALTIGDDGLRRASGDVRDGPRALWSAGEPPRCISMQRPCHDDEYLNGM